MPQPRIFAFHASTSKPQLARTAIDHNARMNHARRAQDAPVALARLKVMELTLRRGPASPIARGGDGNYRQSEERGYPLYPADGSKQKRCRSREVGARMGIGLANRAVDRTAVEGRIRGRLLRNQSFDALACTRRNAVKVRLNEIGLGQEGNQRDEGGQAKWQVRQPYLQMLRPLYRHACTKLQAFRIYPISRALSQSHTASRDRILQFGQHFFDLGDTSSALNGAHEHNVTQNARLHPDEARVGGELPPRQVSTPPHICLPGSYTCFGTPA